MVATTKPDERRTAHGVPFEVVQRLARPLLEDVPALWPPFVRVEGPPDPRTFEALTAFAERVVDHEDES